MTDEPTIQDPKVKPEGYLAENRSTGGAGLH